MTEPSASAEALEDRAERFSRDLVIPPCPDILARFSAEMNKEDPDPLKLARCIGSDVALSAAMLGTVNSPFFGLNRKAASVQQALSLLGLRVAANLIARLLLRNAFPAASGPLMQRFWNDSIHLAGTAADLAVHIEHMDRDEAQTYALFRDCGVAVMIAKFEDYGDFLADHADSPGARLVAAEDARYRFNHALIGHALARSWLLPEPLCKAILFHHDTGRAAAGPANPRLVAFGLFAEQIIALRAGRGLCPDWIGGEAFVLETLKMGPEQMLAMSERESPAEA